MSQPLRRIDGENPPRHISRKQTPCIIGERDSRDAIGQGLSEKRQTSPTDNGSQEISLKEHSGGFCLPNQVIIDKDIIDEGPSDRDRRAEAPDLTHPADALAQSLKSLIIGAEVITIARDLAHASCSPLFTGLYAGVQAGNLGYGSLNDAYYSVTNYRYANPGAGTDSFAGGGHSGYDWRFGNFVAGLIGDVIGASASVNATLPTFAAGSVINSYGHVGVQGSARGHVGYAFDPVLIYVSGGLNLAQVQNKLSAFYGSTSQNAVFAGPTLGVGVEYALNDRWNVNVEAHSAAISDTGRKTPIGAPLVSVRQFSGQGLIAAGVSYRFGY